jgi:hypothetical protein
MNCCFLRLALHVLTWFVWLAAFRGDEVGNEVNRSAPYDPGLQDLVERAYRLVRESQDRLRICEAAAKQDADWIRESRKTLMHHETTPGVTRKE